MPRRNNRRGARDGHRDAPAPFNIQITGTGNSSISVSADGFSVNINSNTAGPQYQQTGPQISGPSGQQPWAYPGPQQPWPTYSQQPGVAYGQHPWGGHSQPQPWAQYGRPPSHPWGYQQGNVPWGEAYGPPQPLPQPTYRQPYLPLPYSQQTLTTPLPAPQATDPASTSSRTGPSHRDQAQGPQAPTQPRSDLLSPEEVAYFTNHPRFDANRTMKENLEDIRKRDAKQAKFKAMKEKKKRMRAAGGNTDVKASRQATHETEKKPTPSETTGPQDKGKGKAKEDTPATPEALLHAIKDYTNRFHSEWNAEHEELTKEFMQRHWEIIQARDRGDEVDSLFHDKRHKETVAHLKSLKVFEQTWISGADHAANEIRAGKMQGSLDQLKEIMDEGARQARAQHENRKKAATGEMKAPLFEGPRVKEVEEEEQIGEPSSHLE
ncbi:MAG: hypothetical protein Q9219_002512 [cf. Caloplaca sp. 3 TL-2023]